MLALSVYNRLKVLLMIWDYSDKDLPLTKTDSCQAYTAENGIESLMLSGV